METQRNIKPLQSISGTNQKTAMARDFISSNTEKLYRQKYENIITESAVNSYLGIDDDCKIIEESYGFLCDIAKIAGLPTEIFKQGNTLAAWYYFTDEKGYHLQQVGAADIVENELAENEEAPIVDKHFGGLDGEENSRMMCLSHQKTLEHCSSQS